MYAIRDNRTLVEIPKREANASPDRYRPVDASYAHRWVKENGIHETGLFIDMDGRIRKAADNY